MTPLATRLFRPMERYSRLTALKLGNQSITYEDLNQKALAFGGLLARYGIRDQKIGIATERSFSAYIGILGAIYAGCSYVPINQNLSKAKIEHIVRSSGIKVLVGDESDWHQFSQKLPTLNTLEYVILPESESELAGLLSVDNAKVVGGRDFLSAELCHPIKVSDDQVAYTIFTSGSTGTPKGVEITRGNLSSFLDNMLNYFSLNPGYTSAQVHPLSFDFSVFQVFFPIITGGVNCVIPAEEIYCPSDFITREEINLWSSVPTVVEMMNKLDALEPGSFPSIQHSCFCGEPLTQELATAWKMAAPNSTVENYYGPTETTVFVSRYVASEFTEIERSPSIVPIGKPFLDHEIALIDEENNITQYGEIVICGSQVAKGYINDPRGTAKSFVSMPWDATEAIWYKTGDLARYGAAGNLEFVGRKDNQIKIAGRRVELEEIESILRGQAGGEGVVVVPLRNKIGIVESLAAFTMVRFSEDEWRTLQNKCKDQIEEIFFPKKFIVVDRFPTTSSGKVDRKKLEMLASDRYNLTGRHS